jgi:peptidoglycan/xylan/chitin deacetylase (PgdA/CDA1 family)
VRARVVVCALLLSAFVAVAVVVLTVGAGGGAVSPAHASHAAPAPARSPTPHTRAVPHLSAPESRRAAVPVLMYHVVNVPPPGAPYPELYVAAGRFAAQMHALRSAGYHATTLRAVWAAWHEGGTLPRRPVVVSFDDGYESDVTHALPVLRRMGWRGVLNLELGKMGTSGALDDGQVRELLRAGWEVDSHTITHPDLTTVDDARLRRELVDSRAEIQRRFGVDARFFAYPSGRYDARVETAVRAAGYHAATTTQAGLARPGTDPFALPRVRVNGDETAEALVAQVRGLGA